MAGMPDIIYTIVDRSVYRAQYRRQKTIIFGRPEIFIDRSDMVVAFYTEEIFN